MANNISNAMERAATSAARAAALVEIFNANKGDSAQNQRARLLEALQRFGSITTIEARKYLDVLSPAPRIFELRRAFGMNRIKTYRVRQASDCGKLHLVGLYVLETDV